MLRIAVLVFFLFSTATVSAQLKELKEVPPPLVIAGAENIHNLRYLPDYRYTGNNGPRGDWEMTLNLYLPKPRPKARLPLVMYVHGGAYSAGHKDESYPAELLRELVAQGFAVGSLNYILDPKGIMPQVFWDFEEAARYLRTHADKYQLDPNAFGAVGISAGGWLITTSGHSDGTVYSQGINSYVHDSQLRDHTYRPKFLEAGAATFLRPTLAPATAYPGVSGRWQVLAYDFAMLTSQANGRSPMLIGMVGKKSANRPKELIDRPVDWTPLVLHYPPLPQRYDQGVHAPNMKETTATRLDGNGEGPITEVLGHLLRRQLVGEEARTPAPEIWPTVRRVTGPVKMTMVTTDPAITVHYTLDGSEPTAKSPRYEAPVMVEPGTRVRALAVMAGRRPSRIVETTFTKGPRLPTITAPDTRELPAGETGKPYTIKFESDLGNARFDLQGDLTPRMATHPKTTVTYPNNMMLRGDGVFTGTPQFPGKFWLQVWVNDGEGRVATHRDYVWEVKGKPLVAQTEATASIDSNVQIAVVDGWSDRNIRYLIGQMQQNGIRIVLQPLVEKKNMVLVPEGDRSAAIEVFKSVQKTTGQPATLTP